MIPGWRSMESRDISQVTKLLNDYLVKFEVAPIFSIDEVGQKFLPKENAIYSFVVEV